MAPSPSAGSRPTLASLCFLMRALLFEYSSPTNLVVEYSVKDAFLNYMSPNITRASSTAVCSLESDVGSVPESELDIDARDYEEAQALAS